MFALGPQDKQQLPLPSQQFRLSGKSQLLERLILLKLCFFYVSSVGLPNVGYDIKDIKEKFKRILYS